MANVVVAIEDANAKFFNNGIGLIKYAPLLASLTAGSCLECELPATAEVLNVQVVKAGVVQSPASFTLALVAETTVAAGKVLVTTAAGCTLLTTTGFVEVSVVM